MGHWFFDTIQRADAEFEAGQSGQPVTTARVERVEEPTRESSGWFGWGRSEEPTRPESNSDGGFGGGNVTHRGIRIRGDDDAAIDRHKQAIDNIARRDPGRFERLKNRSGDIYTTPLEHCGECRPGMQIFGYKTITTNSEMDVGLIEETLVHELEHLENPFGGEPSAENAEREYWATPVMKKAARQASYRQASVQPTRRAAPPAPTVELSLRDRCRNRLRD